MNTDKYNLVYSNNTHIKGIEEVDVNLVLNLNSNVEIGGVEGYVRDENNNPIENATVKIFDQNFTPFAHTITDALGKYQILNVPSADYKINCSKEGYLYNTSSQIFIPNVDVRDFNFTLAQDPDFGKNIIAGRLFAEGSREPIANARILVKNTTNTIIATTYTADDGEFLITDLVDGTYILEPVINGYENITIHTFTVSGGNISNIILTMIKVTVDIKGTYTGQILNNVGVPVANAIVGLYKIVDGMEILVKYSKTNLEGRYMFGNVEEGEYKVKSKNITQTLPTSNSTIENENDNKVGNDN